MNDSLRLLQLSDPHLFTDRAGQLRGVCTYDSLEEILEHACSADWRAEALLLTGDLVHDDPGGYRHLRALLGGLGMPVYCLPGNHDEPEALRAALDAAPFQIDGHFDARGWRVVMLDSVVPGMAHGRVSAAELARLDDLLASARDRHVLVCLHHHPVRMSSRWLDSVGLLNAEEFFDVCDRHPCLRAIAWGHVHQSYDGRRKGVRLLAVPSTCAQFLPLSDNFAIDPAPPGYRRLTLHADGTLDTEVVRLENAPAQQRAACQ